MRRRAVKNFTALKLSGVVALCLGAFALSIQAQRPAQVPSAEAGFLALKGRWVRPDGGYVLIIRGLNADGKLDAAYANPNPLSFSKAEASRDGQTIKVFLELRAGGYNGSTYTLAYDSANDLLKGDYFQAVAQRKFDVHFARAKITTNMIQARSPQPSLQSEN